MKHIEGWLTAPQGFSAAGVKAGIKVSGNHDVAVIYSTVPATTGAVFTQNKMCAAPVLISRKVNEHSTAQAIVVNSGCANACTGERGLKDATAMQEITGKILNIKPEGIYVCSTGVIGQFLPMDKLEKGIQDACSQLGSDNTAGENAALAIQTTDTFIKKSAYETEINGKKVVVAGIAKGAGMIHPNMATMLTYITTDVAIEASLLKKMVKEVADQSFNMVVVDGDTSTNDSMIVLANGLAKNPVITAPSDPGYKEFYEAFLQTAKDLAIMIAHDGEGATKFLEVNVVGAKTWEEAKTCAMAIAKSPLVKTAFFGEDPNWGRIVCAAGYSGAAMEASKVTLALGNIEVVTNGMNANVPLDKLSPVMSEHDISMTINLAAGSEKATVWTCDFSYEYVKINGEYHT